MKPYYEHAGITIYHGDCREVLATLGEVDAVITDPPYGVSYVTKRRAASDPLVAPIAGDESLNALRDAMPLIDKVLKENRHVYTFASARMIGEQVDAVAAFWPVKNVIVWDKGDSGSVGDLDAGYAVTWEAIIYASKGRRQFTSGGRPRAIYRYDWNSSRDPVHPTVKPIGLLSWLIKNSTALGEVVLDPFMGSGTTLRAAKDLGRRAIGIEIEERYCEIAAKRLSQEVLFSEVSA